MSYAAVRTSVPKAWRTQIVFCPCMHTRSVLITKQYTCTAMQVYIKKAQKNVRWDILRVQGTDTEPTNMKSDVFADNLIKYELICMINITIIFNSLLKLCRTL